MRKSQFFASFHNFSQSQFYFESMVAISLTQFDFRPVLQPWCQNESFCRYKDISRKETECICKKTTKGDNCEVDLCSHCQNGGFCDFKDATNDPQCICPFPYYGEFCEGKICLSQIK